MKNKVLVFCLDALCTSDLEEMMKLKNFQWILSHGSVVKHIEPVYPSLTYPCHVSLITGVHVGRHQVLHNAKVSIEDASPEWYNQYSDIQVPTLFDICNQANLTAGAISWPVMGKAPIKYNMPMIVPISYSGDNPKQFLENNATQNLLEQYYEKHGRYLKGKARNLDLYTMSIALDLLEDEQQPDILFVKMCDLDTEKHIHGIKNEHVNEQLRKHDEELGAILACLKKQGTLEQTNIIVLGDHGQMDITHHININLLLKKHGFIRCDEEGKLLDFDAYCHSAALSAWIELKDPSDEVMKARVHAFLMECKDEETYPIGFVFTKEEAKQQFGLEGHFDFVIEGEQATSFGTTLKGEDLFKKYLPEGYHDSKASHGHLPYKDETTTFFGCGPDIASHAVVERRSMVDVAPTLAALLGLTMPDIDGTIIKEFIKEA
ncbi:MAG: alkaline phosphatase family protein [Erysipelotrichaceae bacterium]